MTIQITDDFDLNRIADSGQCFRWVKVEEHTYRIVAGSSCLYITAAGDGRYDLACEEMEYISFWQKYFDLDENYRCIRERIDPEEDPFLWQASEQEKGIRILRQDPWEMLVTSIITQNRNIPAICRSVELIMLPVGGKLFVGGAFRAGREYPKECRETRIDIDRKLRYVFRRW